MNLAIQTAPTRRVLLSVDDDITVCRGVARLCSSAFDEVHVATSPDQAESILRTTPVTHVVCDYFLGPGVAVGPFWIRRWKRNYPSIRIAVILSGSDIAQTELPGEVDDVLNKSDPPENVLGALGVEAGGCAP